MALTVFKTFSAGEVLTASDLNSSLTNIHDNALTLISPLTANLNFDNNQATNLLLEVLGTTQSSANEGRIYWQSTENKIHMDDGSAILRVPDEAQAILVAQIFS